MTDAADRLLLSDEADITKLDVDAIVNAANSALCGGGGVDGAIHAAAGPGLLTECRTLGRCETGNAVLTSAHKLPASYVIHAVGPVWYGGDQDEPALLASCYRSALEIAREHSVKTIAFPAISCGAYRYPVELAARIAVEECDRFLSSSEFPVIVYFCCFEHQVRHAYERALAAR